MEAAFNGHLDVIQAAVIGRRMESGDEEVLAFIQVADVTQVSAPELAEFAVNRLTAYKRPSRIVLATALTAAPTGKLLKHKLAIGPE